MTALLIVRNSVLKEEKEPVKEKRKKKNQGCITHLRLIGSLSSSTSRLYSTWSTNSTAPSGMREMSGSGRKRSSKWDLRDEPQYEDDDAQDDSWHGKAGRSFYPRESGHGWQSPELVGNNGSKWSALETNDLRSKHDMVYPSREPRGSHKNDNLDKESNRYVEDSMAWDADEDYGTRMSPGLDEWRHQNPSQSPKSGWARSLRLVSTSSIMLFNS